MFKEANSSLGDPPVVLVVEVVDCVEPGLAGDVPSLSSHDDESLGQLQ